MPGSALDHLGHHAVICKYGEDVVTQHNMIRDSHWRTCHQAFRQADIGVKVDILLLNWFLGQNCNIRCVHPPLNHVILLKAGASTTAAAQAIESRKHHANDPKCSDLGWVCVYGR